MIAAAAVSASVAAYAPTEWDRFLGWRLRMLLHAAAAGEGL